MEVRRLGEKETLRKGSSVSHRAVQTVGSSEDAVQRAMQGQMEELRRELDNAKVR